MPKDIVRTDAAPKPGGTYSQGVKAGDFLFVAGQDGRDPSTGLRQAGIEEQTRQTLTNVRAILKEAGCTLEDVVKVSVFLNDINDFDAMNKVYSTFFTSNPPARTTIETTFRGDMLVEIDVVALLRK